MAVLDHENIMTAFLAGTYNNGTLTLPSSPTAGNLYSGNTSDVDILSVFVYQISSPASIRNFCGTNYIEHPQMYIDIVGDPNDRQTAKLLANELYQKFTFQKPSSYGDLKCFQGSPRKVRTTDNNQEIYRFAVEGWNVLTQLWILDNGTWNDQGLWVDTEIWNDGV